VTAASITGSTNNTSSGWLAGAGIEWAVAPNWSVKIEYDYLRLNRETFTAPAGTFLAGDTSSLSVLALHTLRADYAKSYQPAAQLREGGATLCMTIAGLRTCERPTAWLGWEDSNSEMSPQIIPLKDHTDCGDPAEFWLWSLFAFELRRWRYAARA
jgi:hypothetical protein